MLLEFAPSHVLCYHTVHLWEKKMGLSVFKLLLILLIVFVIFGAGKLPQVMGDLGKGIRSLKEGLRGEEKPSEETAKIPGEHKDSNA